MGTGLLIWAGFREELVCLWLLWLFVTLWGVCSPRWKWFGPFICSGNNERRCVALTFDDGPDPISTPPLLALLNERKVPATFFCIGKRIDTHPEIARQIVEQGHLLENHSYHHSYWMNFFSRKRLREEFISTQQAIERATGSKSLWFRPPMGLTNPRFFKVARKLDVKIIGWNARGYDPKITVPENVVARIERTLKSGGIILLHDGNIPLDRLLPTVKLLLDRLKVLGYEIVALDKLLS